MRGWPWEHRKRIHHKAEGRLSKKGLLGWVYPAQRLETVDASIFSVKEKPGFLLVAGGRVGLSLEFPSKWKAVSYCS